MERTTRKVWAERVAKLKESGLTLRQFASQIGINHRSLSWWKWQLASKASGTAPKRTRHDQAPTAIAKTTTISPLTFVEMTAATETDRLEVVFSSSVRIRVRPGFDAATLGRLLDVLEARR
jgi:transposase